MAVNKDELKRIRELLEGIERPEGLLDTEEAFAHYLVNEEEYNQGKAYQRLDPSLSDYNAKTSASRMMRRERVSIYVNRLKEVRNAASMADAFFLLDRLQEELNADVADIYTEDGGIKPIHQWPRIFRTGLVVGIETEQEYDYVEGEKIPAGVVKKIKLESRNKIKEMFGKHTHIKAFEEIHTHKVSISEAMELARGRIQSRDE